MTRVPPANALDSGLGERVKTHAPAKASLPCGVEAATGALAGTIFPAVGFQPVCPESSKNQVNIESLSAGKIGPNVADFESLVHGSSENLNSMQTAADE
jgi:hypothetical protein